MMVMLLIVMVDDDDYNHRNMTANDLCMNE